jgi:hypothetical protein
LLVLIIERSSGVANRHNVTELRHCAPQGCQRFYCDVSNRPPVQKYANLFPEFCTVSSESVSSLTYRCVLFFTILTFKRKSIKDRTRSADVRKQLGTRDGVQTAAQLKWKWGGHASRLHESRWAYAATMWDPRTGKRNVGRPRTRWSALFNEIAGRQWTRVARNRTEWRRLEKSLITVQTN